MKSNKENIILETTRLILIILFSYSSIIKLFNVTKFMRTLLVSHFPEEIANIIAFAVVFSEIIIVLLLSCLGCFIYTFKNAMQYSNSKVQQKNIMLDYVEMDSS